MPSVARRDSLTTTRASVGDLRCLPRLFGISKGAGLFLCPSTAEAPEMGMVKVFNLLTGMLDDHRYLVDNFPSTPRRHSPACATGEGRMTRHIIGPPFIVARFMRYLELESIPLMLDPESPDHHAGRLEAVQPGVPSAVTNSTPRQSNSWHVEPSHVRDMYGMIESNMLAIECEHNRKHVPPWCYVPSATSLIRQLNFSRADRRYRDPRRTEHRHPGFCSPTTSAWSARMTVRAAAPARPYASAVVVMVLSCCCAVSIEKIHRLPGDRRGLRARRCRRRRVTMARFSSTVIDHFTNPETVPACRTPTLRLSSENPVCGDQILLTKGSVTTSYARSASEKAFGCSASLAIASILTENLIGMPISMIAGVNTDQSPAVVRRVKSRAAARGRIGRRSRPSTGRQLSATGSPRRWDPAGE